MADQEIMELVSRIDVTLSLESSIDPTGVTLVSRIYAGLPLMSDIDLVTGPVGSGCPYE